MWSVSVSLPRNVIKTSLVRARDSTTEPEGHLIAQCIWFEALQINVVILTTFEQSTSKAYSIPSHHSNLCSSAHQWLLVEILSWAHQTATPEKAVTQRWTCPRSCVCLQCYSEVHGRLAIQKNQTRQWSHRPNIWWTTEACKCWLSLWVINHIILWHNHHILAKLHWSFPTFIMKRKLLWLWAIHW